MRLAMEPDMRLDALQSIPMKAGTRLHWYALHTNILIRAFSIFSSIKAFSIFSIVSINACHPSPSLLPPSFAGGPEW